mgnify:CR=1 FL=1
MKNQNDKTKITPGQEKKSKPMNVLKYLDTVSNLYDDGPPPKSDDYYDGVVAGASKEQMQGLEKRLDNARAFTGDPKPAGLGDNYKSDPRTQVQKKRDEFKAKQKPNKNWKYENRLGEQSINENKPPKRKFNMWKDGVKADKSPQNIADIRKIINDDYKRHGLKYIQPEDRKYLDIKKEKPSPEYHDPGISQLEAMYAPQEQPQETLKQYMVRKDHERKIKEHNEAIKTGIGTMFRINKIK